MTKRYLVKDNMLFKMYKDQYGRRPRHFINFDNLIYFNVKQRKQEQLTVEGHDQLRYPDGRVLPSHVQEIYREWIDDQVERMFTGDSDG